MVHDRLYTQKHFNKVTLSLHYFHVYAFRDRINLLHHLTSAHL